MNIHYSENQTLNAENVKALYEDAQWTLYTKDMPRLMQAIDQSLSVITAWDRDRLVGLIRVVGDGLTIIYIQDNRLARIPKRGHWIRIDEADSC